MKVKNLAEAIIVQAIEDLNEEKCKETSRHFFEGDDFRTCAEIAGIGRVGQMKLLDIVSGLQRYESRRMISSYASHRRA